MRNKNDREENIGVHWVSVKFDFFLFCIIASSVALAAKPSRAKLITMYARWYHCIMLNKRINISSYDSAPADKNRREKKGETLIPVISFLNIGSYGLTLNS